MNQQTLVISISPNYTCLIDEDDFNLVSRFKWFADRHGSITYAKTISNGISTRMHRLVMKARKGKQVDHINGDGLDNRKSNLKISNQRANAQNSARSTGISGYRGVFIAGEKMWRARISNKKKMHHLGYFVTPLEAALAYDKAADEIYGPFGFRNFPTVISIDKAVQWIKHAGGSFFSCGFYKRKPPKTFRMMSCRKGVSKYSRGGSLKFVPEEKDLINVYDMVNKCYRFINLCSIVFMVNGGVEKRVIAEK